MGKVTEAKTAYGRVVGDEFQILGRVGGRSGLALLGEDDVVPDEGEYDKSVFGIDAVHAISRVAVTAALSYSCGLTVLARR